MDYFSNEHTVFVCFVYLSIWFIFVWLDVWVFLYLQFFEFYFICFVYVLCNTLCTAFVKNGAIQIELHWIILEMSPLFLYIFRLLGLPDFRMQKLKDLCYICKVIPHSHRLYVFVICLSQRYALSSSGSFASTRLEDKWTAKGKCAATEQPLLP